MARERRTMFDYTLRRVRPTAVTDHLPPLQPVAEHLWVVDRRIRFQPSLTLPTRMTVIRDRDHRLLLHSPVALDAGLRAALQSLGEVAAVLAPNTFHYIYAGDYVDAFPGARLFIAPGLSERIRSLPPGMTLSAREGTLSSFGLEHAVFGPTRGVSEILLLHPHTGTLIMTDLALNLPRIEGAYNRTVWRLMGVPPTFGPSRSVRLTLLRDTVRAREYLLPLLDWNFDRIVMAHGDIVATNGKREFRRAFAAYLP